MGTREGYITVKSKVTKKDFEDLLETISKRPTPPKEIYTHPAWMLYCSDSEFRELWHSDTKLYPCGTETLNKIQQRAKKLNLTPPSAK